MPPGEKARRPGRGTPELRAGDVDRPAPRRAAPLYRAPTVPVLLGAEGGGDAVPGSRRRSRPHAP